MKIKLWTITALLAVAGPLQATLLTANFSASSVLTPFHKIPQGDSTPFTMLELPQFNANLGTLEEVEITLGVSFSGGTLMLENFGSSAQTGSAAFTANGIYLAASANLGNIATDFLNHAFDVSATSGSRNLSPLGASADGSTSAWNMGTLGAEDSASITSNLGGYLGTGASSFDVSLAEAFGTTCAISGSGNYARLLTPTATFWGNVTYVYSDPVPDNASTALLLVGALIGLAAWRRKLAGTSHHLPLAKTPDRARILRKKECP
jgi:hypothetical protein